MEGGLDLAASVSKAEQSNSSIIYGDRLILKFFRHLEEGINPDLEINRFLTARKFPHSPPLAGALEYQNPGGAISTVGILTTFIPGCKDGWDFTLDTLSRFYDRVATLPAEKRQPPALPTAVVARLAALSMPAEAQDMIGTYLESAAMLGERTAALHLTLASESDDPAFAPEPFTAHSQRGLFQSFRNLARNNLQLLSVKLKSLPPGIQPQAQKVISLEPEILKRFRAIYEHSIDAVRIRHHGDYHLGQVLSTGKDFLILDFEGEPALPISERRLKRSPLRDVAGMIRSFHYAAHAALLKQSERGTVQTAQLASATAWGRFWFHWVSAAFYKAWRTTAGSAAFVPSSEEQLQMMLDIFLLRKAVYELGYELNSRPDWVRIPLQGILELLTEERAP
jgi:maltose alpha-D-glucosyltransferase/alpha-amylase